MYSYHFSILCFITFSTIGFGDLVPNGGEEE